MADDSQQRIDIRGDAKNVVNVVGKDNIVYHFVINSPDVTPEQIQELISTAQKKPHEIEGTTLHNLPYDPNPFFTGREDYLDRLDKSLKSAGATAVSQPPAISGLGGIGKTQIAIEYAYRHMPEYQLVLWVWSQSEVTVTASLGEVARLLDLPQKNEREISVVVKAVKGWLESNGRWLLIFDNADDPSVLEGYVPRSETGRVLITSRASAFGKLAEPLEVDQMDKGEAVDFLLKRARIAEPSPEDHGVAQGICGKLGLLPLAIDQAGAFLEETRCGLNTYLQLFDQKGLEVLRDEEYQPSDYEYTVATTWLMSLERLKTESPAAIQILRLSSFLAPDDIPIGVLARGAEHCDEPLKSAVADPLKLEKTLRALQRYSLIKRRPGETRFSVHRLLQAVLRDGLETEDAGTYCEQAIACVRDAFPDVQDFRNWPKAETLAPNAVALFKHEVSQGVASDRAGSLYYKVAQHLDIRAEYTRAEQLLKRAIEIRQRTLGKDHANVAVGLINLAEVYRKQGRYSEAEPLLLRAIEIIKHGLGEHHPSVATGLNNLAELYRNQGRYSEAESLFKRAIEVGVRTLGEGSAEHAVYLNNLALLYASQGRYSDAEPLYQRAIAR